MILTEIGMLVRMRYNSGWANDPTWSQSKRAKPTCREQVLVEEVNERGPRIKLIKLQHNGDLSSGQRKTCRVWQETPLKATLQLRGGEVLINLTKKP